jgi:hypothetical protein
LDVKAALQPQTYPKSISPEAVKDIIQNAENLLTRMQAAYKESQATISELHAENEALDEEFEEAETRARHLKMQLDNMSSKIAEHDTAMMDLVEQLASEKQARREEVEARSRSIRLVNEGDRTSTLPRHRHNRTSTATTASTFSDSGFESNDESLAENSSASTPALTSSSATSLESSPYLGPHSPIRETVQSRSVSAISRITVFEQPWVSRLTSVGNIGDGPASHKESENEQLYKLKEENVELKGRINYLESELDGCLDLLRGMGLG